MDLVAEHGVPVGGSSSGFDENGLRKFSLRFLSRLKKKEHAKCELPSDVQQDIPYLERRGIKKSVYRSHG